jgi:hypothetical protein
MCHGHVDLRTIEREVQDRLRAAKPVHPSKEEADVTVPARPDRRPPGHHRPAPCACAAPSSPHMTRHIAHFNWATLVADLGDAPRGALRAPCDKVNAMAERSPGYRLAAARRGGKGVRHRLAALHGKSALIASFSVWETPEHFPGLRLQDRPRRVLPARA